MHGVSETTTAFNPAVRKVAAIATEKVVFYEHHDEIETPARDFSLETRHMYHGLFLTGPELVVILVQIAVGTGRENNGASFREYVP